VRLKPAVISLSVGVLYLACAKSGPEPPDSTTTGTGGSPSTTSTGGEGGSITGLGGVCNGGCSDDLSAILDCNGEAVETCTGTDGCDSDTLTCTNGCDAAESAKRSIGCEYYATFMDQLTEASCFATFVANTWNAPAHIAVEYDGAALPVADFAFIPLGNGPGLVYQPYDAAAGLMPGEVVILFLSGPTGAPMGGTVPCPMPSAIESGVMVHNQSGFGRSFRITSDVPVVSYQINPYGGGSAAVTGASLLLPTSTWDTSYIAVNAYDSGPHPASLNIVAAEDDTQVTIFPVANIVGGGGLPPGSANGDFNFTLAAGQHAQLTQATSLTGSIVTSNKPVGFMAGARCSFVPAGISACDHLEQMIPPVRALGNRYVGVMHRPRGGEPGIWRLIGAQDGTTLTWSNDLGGPLTLERGEVVEIATAQPFVVQSQDPDHPFILMSHMSGGSTNGMNGVGDADGVLSVPPEQWLSSYVFFADPTYPETNLVVIRAKKQGAFHDVSLDCAGVLGDWTPIGDYEWTRVDLSTGDFEPVGMCSTGKHVMESEAPFGLWIWGWGTPNTSVVTEFVSYGYPGGMNVRTINAVAL
jgi:IgGFc binding protein